MAELPESVLGYEGNESRAAVALLRAEARRRERERQRRTLGWMRWAVVGLALGCFLVGMWPQPDRSALEQADWRRGWAIAMLAALFVYAVVASAMAAGDGVLGFVMGVAGAVMALVALYLMAGWVGHVGPHPGPSGVEAVIWVGTGAGAAVVWSVCRRGR